MKVIQFLPKVAILFLLFLISSNLTVQAQAPESKGKDYELVVGVPGITASAISDVKTMLGQNTDVTSVIFCPKHDVFLIYLNKQVKGTGEGKSGVNPNSITNSIQNTSGKTAFQKETSATEFYQECSQYIKNN